MKVKNIADGVQFQNLLGSFACDAYNGPGSSSRKQLIAYINDYCAGEARDNLQVKVIEWAKARQIIPNARAATQLMKTGSELGELFDAEIKGDIPGIVDGIGDVLVTLIIYAELNGLKIDECLASAYNEIKDRTGTLLPSGVFVKD